MKLCKFGEDKLNRSCSCKLLESLWMNVDSYWYLLPSELKKPEVADNLTNQCCPNHTILGVVSWRNQHFVGSNSKSTTIRPRTQVQQQAMIRGLQKVQPKNFFLWLASERNFDSECPNYNRTPECTLLSTLTPKSLRPGWAPGRLQLHRCTKLSITYSCHLSAPLRQTSVTDHVVTFYWNMGFLPTFGRNEKSIAWSADMATTARLQQPSNRYWQVISARGSFISSSQFGDENHNTKLLGTCMANDRWKRLPRTEGHLSTSNYLCAGNVQSHGIAASLCP